MIPGATEASIWPKAWRVVPSTICSPSPSVRIALARPCHLPSGKKPVALMTSARTCSGCSQAQRSPMSPPQSWTHSATGPPARSAWKRSTASTIRCQVCGGSGGESP